MTSVDKSFDSEDVFCFKKRSFRDRKKYDDSDSDDSEDEEEELLVSRKKTKSLIDMVDDDDDDDSVEITETRKSKSATNTAAAGTSKQQQQVIDLLDDDDDDSTCDGNENPATYALKHQDSLQYLLKAQRAREGLQQAQNYHAEEEVEVIEEEEDPSSSTNLTIDLPSQRRLGTKYIAKIEIIDGENAISIVTEDHIRKLEPFQKMIDRLKGSNQISFIDTISEIHLEMKEDQKILELTKTPASYKLDEQQQQQKRRGRGRRKAAATTTTSPPTEFNFVVRIVRQQAVAATIKKKSLGFLLDVKLRSQRNGKVESEDTFTIRSKEPFSKLMESYKKSKQITDDKRTKIVFEFDGMALGMNETPETHDMESGEIIEVKLK